ncbi:hypothetical protein P153DRAFT_18433 [Dothidotthia symphoricarpi CBS 119687]|uniref:Uncharacterized protein n=1 Tax=Dothidotthia symphoricarpi CBS 119687 TaxID=1392245 RepID=A0A6A6AEL4_9PLEO|nr:uncharacterized protein P153DRAFT_18433 [Dothidotthia symphoricarpi CBS 119687]KAF2129367.1 hypothetical protein P153DRAFT_18433 [Dothidotthia symphoricarpi CBS 119687]
MYNPSSIPFSTPLHLRLPYFPSPSHPPNRRSKMTFLPLLAALIALSSTVNAHPHHPCYHSPNTPAPANLLPCYTPTPSTHYSCCLAGDTCLDHNACSSARTGTTYQYGCTDRTYRDEHCPQKCSLDTQKSEWVGLVFCNGEYGALNDSWVCRHPDTCDDCPTGTGDAALEGVGSTECADLEYVAFYAGDTLSEVVGLPVLSDVEGWWAEYADRISSTSTPFPSNTTFTTSPGSNYSHPAHPTPPSSATQTAPPTTTPEYPEPPQTKPKSTFSPLCTTIALSLGIPFLLSLLGTGVYFYLHLHHRRRRGRRQTPRPPTVEKRESVERFELEGCSPVAAQMPVRPLPCLGAPFVQPQYVPGEGEGEGEQVFYQPQMGVEPQYASFEQRDYGTTEQTYYQPSYVQQYTPHAPFTYDEEQVAGREGLCGCVEGPYPVGGSSVARILGVQREDAV